LNAVLVANTELTPSEVLKLAQLAEQYLSRARELRWGARTLDVDVLAYGPLITINEVLTLPHPRAVNRRFVLAPWAEIDPDFVISGTGKTVASALASLSTADLASVRRMQDMFLKIPDSPIVDS
jgi:2-amino-4-hydroxy-6-hydroxymethyldihydropteridine diphosphokinase